MAVAAQSPTGNILKSRFMPIDGTTDWNMRKYGNIVEMRVSWKLFLIFVDSVWNTLTNGYDSYAIKVKM